jgi:hypothetical protein
MSKFNKIITVVVTGVFAISALALELTVINTGSKTGSNSVESASYAQDLSAKHTVEFINPGDGCAAYSIIARTKTPVLFGWANDREALGRSGKGCATFDARPEHIIRFTAEPMYVCSMSGTANEFTKRGESRRVGHTTPAFAFGRTVRAVNESFGTNHKSITYDGTGAAKTALLNGEVDYAFLSVKWAKEIQANNGKCLYAMSDEDQLGIPAIGKLAPSNKKLIIGNASVWVLVNADANTVDIIRKDIRKIHDNPESAYNKAFRNSIIVNWNKTPEQQKESWEISVENMR